MRTHVIWVFGCSFGLTACLLSDFREAERRERMRAEAQRTVDTTRPSERVDAGPADEPETRPDAADGGVARAGQGGSDAAVSVSPSPGDAAASTDAAAGAGGHAARPGGAGAGGRSAFDAGGGAAGEAAPRDAGIGPSDVGPSCGDTNSSVEHCGRCDNDCHAEMALASCIDARCVRACASGYGDCNMDLAFGNQGDGCEIDLANNSSHCGGCGRRCEPPWGTIGFCEDQQCQLHTAEIESGTPVAELHGHTAGGDPYEQLCGRGEVQVGIDVATNGDFVLGFAVRCAPLWLGGTPEEMSLATGPARVLPPLGNRAGTPVTPVALECPPGTLMGGVTGVTGYFDVDNTIFTIKALSLLCARPFVSDAWIELEPSSTQSAGSLMGNVVDMFSDNCPAGEAVVGFIGRAGHLIDALSTVCAPISIVQRPQ